MISIANKTDHEIRLLGFYALQKELGVSGLLRFIQQYDQGHGNYTIDRQEWQQSFTVDTLAKEIQGYQEKQKKSDG